MTDAAATANMQREKKAVALNSILAAVGITAAQGGGRHNHGQPGHFVGGSAFRARPGGGSGYLLFRARVRQARRRRPSVRARQDRKLLGLPGNRPAAADLRLDCLRSGQAPVLSFRRDRADDLGVRGDGHLDCGGLVALAAAAPHRRQVRQPGPASRCPALPHRHLVQQR